VLVGGSNAAVFAGAGVSALPAQVQHAGSVSDGELKVLLQGAMALVMPSLDEGFGLPPLEAMALGSAVVVARAGALPEVCGEAAVYVDPLQPASIGDALQRLLAEPPLRERLATAGRHRAAGYTWPGAAALLRGQLARQGALP
jgi:glycosyltransferase involved in cell wall biosynthesis